MEKSTVIYDLHYFRLTWLVVFLATITINALYWYSYEIKKDFNNDPICGDKEGYLGRDYNTAIIWVECLSFFQLVFLLCVLFSRFFNHMRTIKGKSMKDIYMPIFHSIYLYFFLCVAFFAIKLGFTIWAAVAYDGLNCNSEINCSDGPHAIPNTSIDKCELIQELYMGIWITSFIELGFFVISIIVWIQDTTGIFGGEGPVSTEFSGAKQIYQRENPHIFSAKISGSNTERVNLV